MQRPAFQDVAGRDPALRQPSLGQQHPQVPAVGLIDLGVPLAAAGEGGVGRPGQMRRDPGRGQLLDDIPPPGTPLNRERDILAAVPRLFMSTWKRAFRAVVRRCRCRLRRSGGRAAGLPVLRHGQAGPVGARPGTGDPATGRRDGAAAAGPDPLPVLPAHAHLAAVLVRAPARRCDRGDRHRPGGSAEGSGLHADRRGPGPATSRPLAPAEQLTPARALPCPLSGRATDHDHHGVTGAAHRDTVSTAPPP